MTEILFYHLERQPLERVLPMLLEKSLERGWRAVVEAGSAERLQHSTKRSGPIATTAFLPHGIAGGAEAEPSRCC